MPPLTTAKAYASAIATGLTAALAASAEFVEGPWALLIFVALAVLGSYGFVYAVPNATPAGPGRRRRVEDVVDDLLGPPADESPGAPTA